MSKTNNLHDYLADLYQGIASKKPNASKNPQDFRAEIEALGSIGGINGVVEQYTVNAGATVTAGDFVEFVNTFNKGEIISINPEYMAACKLDNTRVLIACIEKYSTSYRSFVQVVSIEDNQIVEGSPLFIDVACNDLQTIHIIALNSNRAVVSAWKQQQTNGARWISMRLLSIDGLNVTSIDELSSNSLSGGWLHQIEALTDSTFLVAYENDDDYGVVAAFSTEGDTLKKMYSKTFFGSSSEVLYTSLSLIKLSATKALLLFGVRTRNTNGVRAVYVVVGFENNAITLGSRDDINVSVSSHKSWCALDENTVIGVVNDLAYLIKVDGTFARIAEKSTSLTGGNTATFPSIVPISTTQAVLVYQYATINSYARIIRVSGEDLNTGIITGAIEFDNGKVDINQLIAFSDSSVVNIFANEFIAGVGMTIDGDEITLNQLTSTYVQPATSRLHNVGVAKTAGSAGEKINVYVVGEK